MTAGERYRPLPTGSHGLDREVVRRDQRERLQQAMIELIAERGYPAVRIADVARLARVSQPTLYSLFAEKEDLLLSAYDEVAKRTGAAVLAGYRVEGPPRTRLLAAMRALFALASEQPDAVSLQMLGAFGAGPRAIERRRRSLETLERAVRAASGREAIAPSDGDHTVMFVLGGMREVIATRLREGRERELPDLAEQLTTWTWSYSPGVPPELEAPPVGRRRHAPVASEQSRRAGRLPSGRSELPREAIVKSQRERIVDATAAIVAEKGLARLTIPEIARRASVSHQTFYDNYASKHDAFLGAQQLGLLQALRVTAGVYEAEADDWPRAIVAAMTALTEYLAAEPAYAHLTVVDTFGASPETAAIRADALRAFAVYLQLGRARERIRELPAIAAEAVTGGVWQVLHHYIERGHVAELPRAAPQLAYLVLTPFVGNEEAARAAIS